jgi:hypothetical protein
MNDEHTFTKSLQNVHYQFFIINYCSCYQGDDDIEHIHWELRLKQFWFT